MLLCNILFLLCPYIANIYKYTLRLCHWLQTGHGVCARACVFVCEGESLLITHYQMRKEEIKIKMPSFAKPL